MTVSFRKKLRKTVITILLVSVSLSAASLAYPKQAEAILFVPVYDIPNAAPHVVNSASNFAEKIKDFGGDGLAWTVAKMAMRMLTASLIDWINSGFNGNPVFVSDIGGFFLDIGDQVAGDFIYNNPDLNFLCRPFSLGSINIKLALQFGHFSSFRQKVSCRLSDVFANVENGLASFTSGNFGSGGWNAWLSVTQMPQNNIYGQYVIAKAEMDARIAGRKEINKQILAVNNGFKAASDALSDVVEMPGTLIVGALNEAFAGPNQSLAASDEIFEMIDSVMGALVTQGLQQGIKALSGNTSTSNRYTTMLRDTSQTTAFYTPSSGQIAQAVQTGSNDGGGDIGSAIESSYNQEYDFQNTTANQRAEAQTCSPAKQDPVINLYKATADMDCYVTNQIRGWGSASLAIDGASQTAAVGYNCPRSATGYTPPTKWHVSLENDEYIEQISYLLFRDIDFIGGFLLRPWLLNGISNGPRVVLKETGGGTNYVKCLTGNLNEGQNETCTGISDNTQISGTVKIKPFKADTIEIQSYAPEKDRALGLSEVKLWRHISPTLSSCDVPATMTPSTGQRNVTVNLLDPKYISATFYPTFDNPQPLDPSNITIVVKDEGKNTIAAGSPGNYSLAPGTYTLIYTATEPTSYNSLTLPGLASAPVEKTFVVIQPLSSGTSGDSGTGGSGNDVTDISAPDKPVNVQTYLYPPTTADISWPAPHDDVGVSGYNIYSVNTNITPYQYTKLNTNGILATNYYVDAGLTPGTTYSYSVEALDGAGHVSPKSDPVSITVPGNNTGDPPPPSGDTTPPNVPTGIGATAISASSITVTWTTSFDSGGLMGYHIYRCQNAGCSNFTQAGVTNGVSTSFTDTGLLPSTSYSYTVSAYDTAGNESAQSTSATATTPANAPCTGFGAGGGC